MIGDIPRAEYIRRRDDLAEQGATLRVASEPAFIGQQTALRSVVDDWDEMNSDQRKRMLGTIFEEIVVDGDGVSELAPREGWRPYLRTALEKPRVLSERKTGLIRAIRTSVSATAVWMCCDRPLEFAGRNELV